MELGLDFDDNDFSQKEKENPILKSYNAKFCNKGWFLEEKADNGKNDPATLNKFRADYYYYESNTETAIEFYRKALDCLGSQNRTMRREIQESLVRCYLQVGWHTEAAKGIELLLGDCLTVDHYCQAFMLKQEVHKASGDIIEEIAVLYQLINLHPVNAFFWLKLADAYTRLGVKQSIEPTYIKLHKGTNSTTDSRNCSDDRSTERATVSKTNKENVQNMGNITLTHSGIGIDKHQQKSKGTVAQNCNGNYCHTRDETEGVANTSKWDDNEGHGEDLVSGVHKLDLECEQEKKNSRVKEGAENSDTNITELFISYPYDLLLLTCFLRARLILQCVQNTVGTFIKDRNIILVEQLNRKIQCLGVDDALTDSACQFIRRDIFEDEAQDDNSQTLEHTLSMICTEDFHHRWFAWIKDDSEIIRSSLNNVQ